MTDNLFEGLPPPSSEPQNEEQQQSTANNKKREASPAPAQAPALKSALKKPKTDSEGQF